MFLPLTLGLRFELAFERLDQFFLAWTKDWNGVALQLEGSRAAIAAALGINAGVGQDHDRRLQALGAMDGHHPHRIARCAWIAHDLHVAARKPVEEALQGRRCLLLELKRAGEQLLDRIASLRAEPVQQLAAAIERNGQYGLE